MEIIFSIIYNKSSVHYIVFMQEIEPITVKGRRGEMTVVSKDDGPWRKDPSKLKFEKGRFGGSGSVTAGNASPVSDGAAALVLMSASKAKELRLPVSHHYILHKYSDFS